MSKHTPFARTAAALRDLDSASTITLTGDEQQRANATLSRILASPGQEHVRTTFDQPHRRRALVLVPASLLAAAAIVLPMALNSGSAFSSWSPIPATLAQSTAAEAAMTCRLALDIQDPQSSISIGERRGGWTYVRLAGIRGEGACLMPDDLVGSRNVPSPKSGLFGTYDPDPAEPPTPPRDGIVETESTNGTVVLPGHASLGTVEGWFTWTTGYAGSNVTGVTVHPPVGPAVEASLIDGRFSAWWPSGEARGDNPGVGGAWTYTVTLTDGTSRQVEARG
jgi:hypothetical protein